ncbi:MAG: O-antigen ligase family protein [Phycisphaerales bacterium]
MPDLTFNLIAGVIIIAITGHLALVIASRWVSPMFLLTGAFFVFSPLSAAQLFPFTVPAKYGRVYITLLLLFVGIFFFRAYRLGQTAFVFLTFVGLYVLASLWSDFPLDALKYKGLYGLSVVSGFLLARSVRDFRDLEIGLRALVMGAAVFGTLMLVEVVRNPSTVFHLQRLSFWGMNANRIGQTIAPMLIVTAYVALFDRAAAWRLAAYVIGGALGILLMYTGSRGGAGEALLGCFIVATPLIRRPFVLIVVAGLVGFAVVFTLATAATDAPERLLNLSLETREGIWDFARSEFADAPVFGQGWIYNTGGGPGGGLSSRNMHSIYVQVAVETGAFGVFFMGIAMLFVLFKGLSTYRYVRSFGIEPQTVYLALGLVAAVLAHGVIEAGTVMGSTLNGMMLPFGIALFDRLPELIRQASYEWYDTAPEDTLATQPVQPDDAVARADLGLDTNYGRAGV